MISTSWNPFRFGESGKPETSRRRDANASSSVIKTRADSLLPPELGKYATGEQPRRLDSLERAARKSSNAWDVAPERLPVRGEDSE